MTSPGVIRSFDIQARACAALGSPFSAALLERARDEATGAPLAKLLEPWADASFEAAMAHAVPLRLLGALHAAALSDLEPALTACYPAEDRSGDVDAAWDYARRMLARRAPAVATFMAHEPQTNEVRRSACLLGGFLEVAARTGLPLRTFEVGASAGLNLSWDRYHYRLGDAAWGDATSPVLLDSEWRGALPRLDAPLRVISRAGCDRRPVYLSHPDHRLRLAAYVWADQTERLERLRAAMALAMGLGVAIEAADAPAWAKRAAPLAGTATVLCHSVFWQYMPARSQARLARVIAAHGAAASPDAPFAWLRMEPSPEDVRIMQVRLTLWPHGEMRVLANVHPHGAWVEWLGD